MNTNKAQKEIFDSILRKEDDKYVRVVGFWIVGDRFAVTGDGYHGFIFKKDQIAFDVSKVPLYSDFLHIGEIYKEENELNKTRLFYKERQKGVTSIIFKGKNGKIYVNKAFLSCFSSDASYYQERLNGTILVEEYGEIVGFALPIRHDETED